MHGFFLLRAAEMLSGEFHDATSLTLLDNKEQQKTCWKGLASI
jgi:hypothetical protein